MDADAKKTALRMIPYGLYVLTATDGQGQMTAAAVNWVTQTSFAPPLVAVAVKADSGSYEAIKQSRAFTLNMLGKGQQKSAFAFFKPAQLADGTISGHAYETGETGAPILSDAPAAIECRVREIVAEGDHHVVLGEVVAARVSKAPSGRPDAAILEMKELGDNVFYGG